MSNRTPSDRWPTNPSTRSLVRMFNWAQTRVGAPEGWPPEWRTALQICLDSSFPTCLVLGEELELFYNDGYAQIAGDKHPASFGKPARAVWPEIWSTMLEPIFSSVLITGEPVGAADLPLLLHRHGFLEEAYFTFSYSAIRTVGGRTGLIGTAVETTSHVLSTRRLGHLGDLSALSLAACTVDEACSICAELLAKGPKDVAYAALYLAEPGEAHARLRSATGLSDAQRTELPAFVELGEETRNSEQALVSATRAFAGNGATAALAIPLGAAAADGTCGLLLVGPNPQLPADREYRSFLELAAVHVCAAIANARVKQEATERVSALATLDQAKTSFFSNVSHELRTPLTLILGQLEAVLDADRVRDEERDLLEVALRNCNRLGKLVNTLLDFSRLEAGRLRARFAPVELAAATAELANSFRASFERAGIEYVVDCRKLPEPSYVDRELWDKIVLNLLSNALKFTLEGRVMVSLSAAVECAELRVEDTGCGIAPGDLDRVFDRFVSTRASRARTHEGAGIGLSLVAELVKLHGGTVNVESALGRGSRFTVRIPHGSAHLPQELVEHTPRADASFDPSAYVDEVEPWLPIAESGAGPADAERVVVADDNADMRRYLARLLGKRWRVEEAPDGASALACVRAAPTGLVVADVMMPGLDGLGLARTMRDDPQLASVPIVLLSARAGEETSIEALGSGAVDYLVKPFSARELVARVEARLAHARARAAERAARAAAERENRTKDEFLAVVSHELKTPVCAILGWTQRLHANRTSPERVAHALTVIERNGTTLAQLIGDLLDVSRIVAGKMQLTRSWLASVEPIVEAATDALLPSAEQAGVRLETRLEHCSAPILGDPDRLQQVVWNLVSNAIKFTPRGGQVEVRCAHAPTEVSIEVLDTGRGIAPEFLPHVFERFSQEARVPARTQRGLGLGLAITRQLVEQHGGTIEAYSAGPGRGSSFRITLPIAADECPMELEQKA